MNLRDAAVLITGASDGIGAALAAELRSRGARLALTGRNPQRLASTARPGDFTHSGDLTDPAFRASLYTKAVDALGPLDVLVNNAGVGLYQPPSTTDIQAARALFELNFFAAADLSQRAIASMLPRRRGVIVNVSSIAGRVTLPWFSFYSASKFALTSLTEGLQAELAGSGVRALIVSPGYVRTGFQDNVLAGEPPPALKEARRFATSPEACARAIADGIVSNTDEVITPWSGRLLVLAARWTPTLLAWQLARMNRTLETSQ